MEGEYLVLIVSGWSSSPVKAIYSSLREGRRTFSHFPLDISMRFALIAKLRRSPNISLRVYSFVFGISSSSMIRMLPGFVRLNDRQVAWRLIM